MSKQILKKLTEKSSLTFKEAQGIFEEIFNGSLSQTKIAALLVALKMKGETEDEIAAAASVVLKYSKKIKVRPDVFGSPDTSRAIIDTCGTGGSGLDKFNISTATAFVVSASGAKVAKHGNKAMSSNCGSADVLQTLGVNIGAPFVVMRRAIDEVGIGFLYAPLYHPALKDIAAIRKDIGVRTIFNILGPLCNPASANYQLLGVYKQELVLPMARVLRKLNTQKALVVYGCDVGDEISLTGPTKAAYLHAGKVSSLRINPSDFGLKKITIKDILVKDAKSSAKVIESIIRGKPGAPRDIVLANASACFYLLGKVDNFKKGVKLAASLIDEGKVADKLKQFKEFLRSNA
jgi:anthranilate phosphoribosyltransferase